MFKKSKEEDSIHLRAIRYGVKYPNGFMYANVKHYYSKRLSEWAIVNEYLNEAWNNKNGVASRITPFVLLEKMGNGNADQSKYTLSYEAYFAYLQYRNAKNARFWSIIAIAIATLSILGSIIFSYLEIKLSNKTNIDQENKVFQHLKKDVRRECFRKNYWNNKKNMFNGNYYEHF